MEQKSKKFRPTMFFHIVLSLFTIIFFHEMGAMNKEAATAWTVFNGFALFETVMLFLSVFNNVVFIASHLFYQYILFVYPCFLFFITLSYDIDKNFTTTHIFANFQLEQVEKALSNHVNHFWVTAFFFVWMGRIVLHRSFVIQKVADYFIRNKTKTVDVIKETREMRRFLNTSVITLFILLAYFTGGALQNIFISLAIFEMVISFSFTFSSRFLMNVHTLYQAVTFSVPFFLLCVVIVHEELPSETDKYLRSYGLVKVSGFVSQRPWCGATALFSFWFFRLLHTVFTVVEVDAQHAVRLQKKDIKKHHPLIEPL